MLKNKKILALIPARSGSKGLKNKNIKILGEHPLLVWPLLAVKKLKYNDKIIISTDSKKYAEIAKKYGGETPFLRPKKMSGDKASSIDVIMHAIDFFEGFQIYFDYILYMEPTSPFTSSKDIDKCLKALISKEKNFDSLVGVSSNEKYNRDQQILIDKNLRLKEVTSNIQKHKRRQDSKETWYPDGSIYVSTIKSLKKHKTIIDFHKFFCLYIKPRFIFLKVIRNVIWHFFNFCCN